MIAKNVAWTLALCMGMSAGVAVAAEGGMAQAAAADYKPRTEHDNTPYRFNMEQDGKRMSADEFDAWMKARGVRVAKGAPAAATPVTTPEGQDVAAQGASN